MRNKGFTLIELLAVIVILAIIALIATPIILNIIMDSKEESNKRSIEMYAEALKNSIANYQLDGTKLEINKLNIKEETRGREFENTNLKVEYDGNVVCRTIEVYYDGNIYLANCKVNDEEVDYDYGKDQSYDNGQIVYFDVETGKSCTNYHEDNSKTGYNGLATTKTTDNQNSCLKFYAFLDDGNKNLNLLLDHNTTAKVAWNSSNSNASGPLEVINQLKIDTNEWIGTIIPSNYEYKGTARPYTINYSEYKARLITAQEIAKITGADKENTLNFKEESSTGWYFLDGAKTNDTVPNWQTKVANSTNKSAYYWLFDRAQDCVSNGCEVADSSNYGYWTSSALASNSNYAWIVLGYGYVGINNSVNYSIYFGVRPVITVLKSNIKN